MFTSLLDRVSSQTLPFLLLIRALESFFITRWQVIRCLPFCKHLQTCLVSNLKNRFKLVKLKRPKLRVHQQIEKQTSLKEIFTSCTGIGIYQHPAITLASARVLTLDTLFKGCKPAISINNVFLQSLNSNALC